MTAEAFLPEIGVAEAASVVGLRADTLADLVEAGYLAGGLTGGAYYFSLDDLEAFVARNAGRARSRWTPFPSRPDMDPEELMALLDERAGEMARRMLAIYTTVFPDAAGWDRRQQEDFVARSHERLHAVLAVASSVGGDFDTVLFGELFEELRQVGSAAAQSRVGLPALLALLRLSRDLVVRNAVELADGDDRSGGFALSMLLTRILPTMDRLGDALTEGYWKTLSGS